jgi:hypothetical protein
MKIINPLAQSFYVEQKTGIFATSVDLFFHEVDPNIPITIQLRPMKDGRPSKKVYPFSEVTIDPEEMFFSDDGSIVTNIQFDAPVYLKGKRFHALVIVSNSPLHSVWTAKLGEIDTTIYNGPESKEVVITKQPLSGGIFKSQNGNTWVEEPYEDLTFRLYRANFSTQSGNISLRNPKLDKGNTQIARLVPDALEMSSRQIRVGLGTTVNDSGIQFGNTILQLGSNAYGNYVGTAGSATSNLKIINSGIGYTPSLGQQTFSGIALTSITGFGYNATADITIQNGVAIAATVSNGGIGYAIGDVLTADQIGIGGLGRNLQLSVSNLSGQNQLIIDNVQGDFATGVGKTIQYVNSSGITTDLNSSVGGNVLILDDGIQTIADGLHVKVNHKNHGMHSRTNTVVISDVKTNLKPVKLTSNYVSGDLDVDSVSIFSTFENVGVSSTNPGYVQIGSEILSYEGISGSSLINVSRNIDGDIVTYVGNKLDTYTEGTEVYKYELNGISLRRINKQHSLEDASISDRVNFDHYYIKIDTSQDGKTDLLPNGQVDRSVGTSFPKLYSNESRSLGGNEISATQNIQFEIIKPNIQTMSLNGTNITAKVRTVSGTSVDGSELSFTDKGYQNISLNSNNFFDSPRLICSDVNEQTKLSALPSNKSFALDLELTSASAYLSPTIDLDRTGMIFVTNRVNNHIDNYTTDNRVATLEEDPSAFVYATNPIELEAPSTSIKILVAAYVNTDSDLRALYAIQNDPSDNLVYYPFPGYNNINNLGQVIDDAVSDGRPDSKKIKSDVLDFPSKTLPYTEYEFTIDNLASFRYFSIKLVGSSSNQAFPPRLKDLRVIALA